MNCDKTTMLNVCRICLCSEGNIYSMSKYKLKNTFEHITGISLQEDNTLPQNLCSECAQRLINCGRLRQKSIRANTILTELARKYENLTVRIIKTVDRNTNQLHSSLSTKVFAPDHFDFNLDPEFVEVKIENEVFVDESFFRQNQGDRNEAMSYTSDREFLDSDDDMPIQQVKMRKKLQRKKSSKKTVKSNQESSQNKPVVMLEKITVKTEKDLDVDTNGLGLKADGKVEIPVMQLSGEMASTSFVGTKSKPREERITKISNSEVGKLPVVEKEELSDNNEIDKCDAEMKNKTKRDRQLVDKKQDKISHPDFSHLIVKTEDCFACGVCGNEYKRKYHLNRHLKAHTGIGLFECDVCKKSFPEKNILTIHRRKHTGEKPYSCEICGVKFSTPYRLNDHIKQHTEERLYSCEICKKRFWLKTQLTNHFRTHTGEKPYSCEFCGKKFSHGGLLTLHRRIHTGEKPYACKSCPKKFSSSSRLSRHLLSHTGVKPYSCEICCKGFRDSGYLKIHARMHTGEKPYNCKVCNKSFSRLPHLKKHLKKHTGIKFAVEKRDFK